MIGCNNKAIGNEILESLIVKSVNEIEYNKNAIIAKITKIVTDVINMFGNKKYDFEKTEREIQRIEAKKLKNLDAFYDNLISSSDCKKMTEEYQNQIDKLQDEINAEREKEIAVQDKTAIINEICSTITKLVHFEEFDDSIAKEILDRIVVNSKYDIEVYIKGFEGNGFFFTSEGYILDNKYQCQ